MKISGGTERKKTQFLALEPDVALPLFEPMYGFMQPEKVMHYRPVRSYLSTY